MGGWVVLVLLKGWESWYDGGVFHVVARTYAKQSAKV